MSKGKGLFGWLLGLAAGTALGVLFAPRKGEETRRRLKKAREAGGAGYEPLVEDVQQMGKEVKTNAKKLYKESDLADLLDSWRDRLQEFGENLVGEGETFYQEKISPLQENAKEAKKLAVHHAKKIKKAAEHGKRAVEKIKKTLSE